MIKQVQSKYFIIPLFIFLASCSETETRHEYYESGKIKVEQEYKNNVPNGVYKEYYEDGSLRRVQYFKDSLPNGKLIDYYPDGSISQIFNFKKGKKVDTAKIYYESGSLMELQVYYNGKIAYFEKFQSNGERKGYHGPTGYIKKDTVRQGETMTLKMRMANYKDSLYLKGVMIITSGFDSNHLNVDTLKMVESNNNIYTVDIKAKERRGGPYKIRGCLIYTIPYDSGRFTTALDRYNFSIPYWVK